MGGRLDELTQKPASSSVDHGNANSERVGRADYTNHHRFSNYMRDNKGDPGERDLIMRGEDAAKQAFLRARDRGNKSKPSTKSRDEGRPASRSLLVDRLEESMMMPGNQSESQGDRSIQYSRERRRKPTSALVDDGVINADEKRLAEKITEKINEDKREEAKEYSKILQQKLHQRRILVRDKKENQNKMFRDMLQNIALKHFQPESKSVEKNPRAVQPYVYIDNADLKKVRNHLNIDLGLTRLKDQLLDDFVYLSNKGRNNQPRALDQSRDKLPISNASVLSKEYSHLLDNEAMEHEGKGKHKSEIQSEASKRVAEINEFLMEKTVLNFKNVARDPTNEGLSYNLNLCTKLPDDYENSMARRWFELGVEKSDETDLLPSINCFKQAVIHDSELFQAIYNLGCMYENVKDFELAFKWFYLAKTIEPEDKDVNFALAFCFYKLKKYSKAIELLEKYCVGVQSSHESGSGRTTSQYCKFFYIHPSDYSGSSVMNISSEAVQTYILSICYKGDLNFEKAEAAYNKFISMIDDSSNREIALNLFALLNKKNSGFSVRKLEEIKMGLLRAFKSIFPDEYETISKYWDPVKKVWYPSRLDGLIDALTTMNFFKRYPRQILKEALTHCGFDKLKKDSIVFYSPETEQTVYIVVKGAVTVKDHSLNIEVPRTAIQLQPGDIINPGNYDGGLLKSFHFWFRCSNDVEVITLSRKSFEVESLNRQNLWFAQTTFGLDTRSIIFRNMALFKQVSDTTIHKMVYDLIQVLVIDKPTIVYDDKSYFDEYESFRKEAFEKKIQGSELHRLYATPTRCLFIVRLAFRCVQGLKLKQWRSIFRRWLVDNRRKSNVLNRLIEANNDVRELIKTKSKASQAGLYIVLEGQVAVYNDTGRKITDLPIGSTFGENLLARVGKTYSSFGIIATGTKRTQLGFIPKGQFYRIPSYDVYQMHLVCQKRKDFEDIKVE